MSLDKVSIFGCLLITGFVVIHVYLVGIATDKAYNQGYDEGMVAISPDYSARTTKRSLDTFNVNIVKGFRNDCKDWS